MQSRTLVQPGWQYHHGALIEDDLQFQPELLNRLQHRLLMRFPRSHNAMPRFERHPAPLQLLQKGRGGRIAQRLRLPALRIEQQCTVLRNHSVENVEPWENLLQIR